MAVTGRKLSAKRIAEGGYVAAAGLNGAVTLQRILDGASE
jgi:hypothetical protein